MNKKFSTLLASVLLTSAFSVNAGTPVEGDYVRLAVGGQYIGVADGALALDDAAATTPGAQETYKDVFANINTQLWKIAKITKAATTGAETYQFINKQTGEYLAIKLVTDQEDHTSESEAKLNPAGNKDWAFDGDKLYYYDAKQDSTFYLEDNLSLSSKPGKNVSSAAKVVKTDVSDQYMGLTADAFNALMKLTGNDGKLHFNNGKDVSEKESNILKNTKWEAIPYNASTFALTNGKTVEGYTNDVKDYLDGTKTKYYKINKKKFLQVDTTFFDDAKTYHKLVVDTVGYEPYDAVADKYGEGTFSNTGKDKKRPSATAEFEGAYFIANDSIVLKAKAKPMVATVSGPGTPTAAKCTQDAPNAATVDDFADGEPLQKTAVENILAAVEKFIAMNPQGTASVQKFDDATIEIAAGAKKGSEWLATLTGTTATADQVTAFKALFAGEALKFKATTEQDGKIDNVAKGEIDALMAALDAILGTSGTSEQAKLVKAAYDAFKAHDNGESAAINFKDCYYSTTTGAWSGITTQGSDQKGSDFINAVNTTGWAIADITNWNSLVEKLNALTIAKKDFPVLNGNNPSDIDKPAQAVVDALANELKDAYAANTTLQSAMAALKTAVTNFTTTQRNTDTEQKLSFEGVDGNTRLIEAVENAGSDASITSYLQAVRALEIDRATATTARVPLKIYYNNDDVTTAATADGQVVLRKLSSATVLTIAKDEAVSIANPEGYVLPLIQPYATTGGDAKIAATNYHFIQVKNEAKVDAPSLRAADPAIQTNKYWIVDWKTMEAAASTEVSEFNPFTQWAFVETSTGAYSIINRATEQVMYTGPLFKVADAADTYTNGTDTLKIAAVTLPESTIITEGDKKYDVAGSFYPGKDESLIKRLFTINPVSPFMSQLAAQFNKDSVLILGDAADAPVWQLEEVKDSKDTYGYVIEGTTPLLAADYHIYTKDRDDNVYYVTLNENKDGYILTKSTSKLGAKPSEFSFIEVAENQYVIVDYQAVGVDDDRKMTINPTPAKPILEASILTSERNDLFTFTQVNQNVYRTLAAEDGVLGNAKIYMENEPNRYLYENTANIVANNGTGYNFLGIYNTAELTKNAALYVDTAYVNREDNLMPQYMFALGVETVDAKDAVACTYEHNHYDNAGNKVDAEHCSHATPATMGYKTGRYLVALSDSVPTTTKVHPTLYDGAIRLAFVPAIHRNAEDALIIKNSKYTGNSKQQVAGKETTWAAKDTMKIADQSLNPATFALLIKDQATKSFYLENKEGYVRILNGVPVLTTKLEDAAVFNIEATTEEATANEAIEAATVQVIAGKGVVTVQGAAGKVVTVANILGQTIANQVAASDNVTIAAPAGVVVVAVDGDATKVVVK